MKFKEILMDGPFINELDDLPSHSYSDRGRLMYDESFYLSDDTKWTDLLNPKYFTPKKIYSSYTASTKEALFVDSSRCEFVILFPSDPGDGDEIIIIDTGSFLYKNPVIVKGNGKYINYDSRLILDVNNVIHYFSYNSTGNNWDSKFIGHYLFQNLNIPQRPEPYHAFDNNYLTYWEDDVNRYLQLAYAEYTMEPFAHYTFNEIEESE